MSVRRNRKVLIVTGITTGAFMLGATGAFALNALSVDVPLFPAVGEANAGSCDTDGVTTTYTYGNSSANGMKITAASVKSIASACATGSVEFLLKDVVVTAYPGSVSSGTMNVSTSIFTGQFDAVRVVLNP